MPNLDDRIVQLGAACGCNDAVRLEAAVRQMTDDEMQALIGAAEKVQDDDCRMLSLGWMMHHLTLDEAAAVLRLSRLVWWRTP